MEDSITFQDMQLDTLDRQTASIRREQTSAESRRLSVAVSFPLAFSSFSSFWSMSCPLVGSIAHYESLGSVGSVE